MAKDEWEEIPSEEEQEREEQMDEDPVEDVSERPSGKYDRLLGADSKKFKLSAMFKDWFLDYLFFLCDPAAGGPAHRGRSQAGPAACAARDVADR